jgi:photosystem II stability/assembly factor-like uncharacterized protein
MSRTLLMVGTRKGLWMGTSDEARTSWEWTGPHFPMEEVYSVMIDTRGDTTPRLLVGASSSWLGPQVWRSDDLGTSWGETPNGAARFPEDTGATLARVWQLQPGFEDDVVWAGTEPGAVFRSTDRGETFSLVRGLWDHPHREEWSEGFGGQAFHTILPDPRDGEHVLAALSTGGVYTTADGGESWSPSNRGVKAEFFPGERQYPEFGQCVHKVARDATDPDRLYLQNHGGVYRSDDGGSSWQDIAPGLPTEFGFAMVAHPHRAATAYNFPIDSAGSRWPVDGKARVYRTTDAGSSWQPLGEGSLPDGYFTAVMRDAMCTDDHDQVGLYFGGRNGGVWASPDEGSTWQEIHKDLPDVLVVRAAQVD